MSLADCLFCKFAEGSLPCHKVWEDEAHLAFLTIFPNTEGFTVVIPKKHQPSYFADCDSGVINSLMQAASTVSKKIDAAYDDVGRTGLIFEGFGVDHLHAKLSPMHGTAGAEWEQRLSENKKYTDVYEGHISSHDSYRADYKDLARIAKKIAQANTN